MSTQRDLWIAANLLKVKTQPLHQQAQVGQMGQGRVVREGCEADRTKEGRILVLENNDDLRHGWLSFFQAQGHFVRGVALTEELLD